jgi:hypothetical protein
LSWTGRRVGIGGLNVVAGVAWTRGNGDGDGSDAVSFGRTSRDA